MDWIPTTGNWPWPGRTAFSTQVVPESSEVNSFISSGVLVTSQSCQSSWPSDVAVNTPTAVSGQRPGRVLHVLPPSLVITRSPLPGPASSNPDVPKEIAWLGANPAGSGAA